MIRTVIPPQGWLRNLTPLEANNFWGQLRLHFFVPNLMEHITFKKLNIVIKGGFGPQVLSSGRRKSDSPNRKSADARPKPPDTWDNFAQFRF